MTGFERADLSRERGWAHCVIDLLQLVAADVAHELSEAFRCHSRGLLDQHVFDAYVFDHNRPNGRIRPLSLVRL